MSRIGKKPIEIPDKVQVDIRNNILFAKGPKGQLELNIPTEISCHLENGKLVFSRDNDLPETRSLHGLTRALAWNVIEGVTSGFSKTLLIEGVGYKAEQRGKNLLLSLGFSHSILIIPPDGIKIESPNPTTINVSGIDKQLVGQVAARIRKLRPPEPYKGKGIRYDKEIIRRKAGKTAA